MAESPDASEAADREVAAFNERLRRVTPHVFVTPVLVAINAAVFVLMIVNGVHLLEPLIADLIAWGANYGPRTMGGEWWRLLTSNYIHIGLPHILFNMWVLWSAGPLVERLMGNTGFVIVYVMSGVFGSLISLLWNPLVVSAGASGAVFGIYGCLLGILLLERDSIPTPVLKHLGGSTVAFVAYNVIYGLGTEGIDMAAHVGGLITGFLCGLAMRSLATRSVNRRWVSNAIVSTFGATVIALAIVSGLGHVADVESALMRFGAVEERVLALLDETMARAQSGALSNTELARTIDQQVLAPWRAARETFERQEDVPSEQQAVFARFVAYMTLREEAIALLSEGIETDDENTLAGFAEKMQEVERVIAEIEAITKAGGVNDDSLAP
jgi:rhomboid protease GluP